MAQAVDPPDYSTLHANSRQQVGITALVFSLAAYLLSQTIADPDLWWHLRFGLDLINSGHLGRVDIYSYLTAGQIWIKQEWLSEVLFALVWKLGGAPGLVLVKMGIGLLVILLLYRHLASIGAQPVRSSILLALALFLLKPFFITVRGQIFSILLFIVVLLILREAETGKYRNLWILVPVFALWTNLHGGFLAGVGIVSIWTSVHFLQHRQSIQRIIFPVLAAFMVLLVNPYGINLLDKVVKMSATGRPEIVEWQPLSLLSALGITYLALLALLVSGIVFSRCVRRLPLLLILALIAVLPLSAIRHLQFFASAAIVFGGEHILSAWQNWRPSSERKQPSRLLPALSAAAALLLAAASLPNLRQIQLPIDPPVPQQAVALLKESGITGNLALGFLDWGGYVLWHTGPQIQVSIDGRQQWAYPESIYQENLLLMYGAGRWDSLLTRHPTDLALVYKQTAAYNLLRLYPGWVLVYQDETSALFSRHDFPGLEQLHQAARKYAQVPFPQSPIFP
jgi:hypothetical protein